MLPKATGRYEFPIEAQSTWTTLRLVLGGPILHASGFQTVAAGVESTRCHDDPKLDRVDLNTSLANVLPTKSSRIKMDVKVLSAKSAGRPVVLPSLPSLPNMQDKLVLQTLATASIGSLEIDRLGHLLSKDGTPPDNQVIGLRLALMRVYLESANSRFVANATKDQIKSAKAALASLGKATKQLDQAKPPRQRGLQGLLGSPSDDPKGLDELNEFGSKCSQIKLDVAGVLVALAQAIDLEMKKPKLGHAGERKKRLRTLVEALARWWKSLGGSLAPYVQAKRQQYVER